jgi:hypothetical protein
MNEPKIHRLNFGDGGDETVLLNVISSNIYRLESTPVWTERELYFGDAIEIEPQTGGTLRFVRLVERGQFRHYSWFLHKEFIESSQYVEFTAAVEGVGGKGLWKVCFSSISRRPAISTQKANSSGTIKRHGIKLLAPNKSLHRTRPRLSCGLRWWRSLGKPRTSRCAG